MEKWLATLIKQALKLASPAVVKNLREAIQKMVDHAETTENPWDDIIAFLLQMIVGKPGDTTETDE